MSGMSNLLFIIPIYIIGKSEARDMDEKSVLREFILIDGMDSRLIFTLINFRSHFNVNEVNRS
jgi:hypothetical protein